MRCTGADLVIHLLTLGFGRSDHIGRVAIGDLVLRKLVLVIDEEPAVPLENDVEVKVNGGHSVAVSSGIVAMST